MELKCVIIDDEHYILTQIEELILMTPGVIHEKSFDNAYNALTYLHDQKHVDIVFLDIEMPQINGIEAAKLLRAYCDFLVFVTGHAEYGAESFEIGVDGYLLKPVSEVKFIQQVQRLLETKSNEPSTKNPDNFLLVKGGAKHKYISIQLEKILYIKSMSNYIQIFLADEEHISYHTLKHVEEAIRERTEFLRINRSEIISFNHVKQVDGYQILLNNGKRFVVSRSYKNKFDAFLRGRLPGPGIR
ncbi:LytTR family DNA-binding domain-containing protein [Pedobacter miscanthi]|uniref:LytR/AlgR family response regulator transcription factor n=1 Tax=Pedobacter miscanthi TaxID=2259170 RepID=UPI0029311EB7|nr:LytTR family DNA-binding domain-containing protein [Pedobacter miscanthi]